MELRALGVIGTAEADAAGRAALQIPEDVWDVIRSGRLGAGASRWSAPESRAGLILSTEQSAELDRVAGRTARASRVAVAGPPGSGRRTIAAELARRGGRGVVHVAPGHPAAGALAALLGADLVVDVDEEVDVLAGTTAFVLTGEDGRCTGTDDTIVVHPLGPLERASLWRASLPSAADVVATTAAERYRWPPATIRRVAGHLAAAPTGDGAQPLTIEDLAAAHQRLFAGDLAEIGQIVAPTTDWSALAADPVTRRELQLFADRCAASERLRPLLGTAFAAENLDGAKALFAGPSGTGKSLAARCVASALHKLAVIVDLSRVVSKYIGETEKNLDTVFSAAQRHDVVLILDEGDALLAKRTDVGNAHDRYANIETNYLLHRLERHRGVVLITSNAADRIDAAFTRRLDARIDFRPPDRDTRLALLRLHLPDPTAVTDGVLAEIAERCEITGGQIRGIVAHAALLALEAGALGDDELVGAVQRHYRTVGATSPMRAPATT